MASCRWVVLKAEAEAASASPGDAKLHSMFIPTAIPGLERESLNPEKLTCMPPVVPSTRPGCEMKIALHSIHSGLWKLLQDRRLRLIFTSCLESKRKNTKFECYTCF